MWRVNQIGRRIERFADPDWDAWTFAPPLNFKVIDESAAQKTAVNLIVERGDEKRISAFGVQGLGQRSGNIGEAAGLSKGNCFR